MTTKISLPRLQYTREHYNSVVTALEGLQEVWIPYQMSESDKIVDEAINKLEELESVLFRVLEREELKIIRSE